MNIVSLYSVRNFQSPLKKKPVESVLLWVMGDYIGQNTIWKQQTEGYSALCQDTLLNIIILNYREVDIFPVTRFSF